jgi:hypothetical protein
MRNAPPIPQAASSGLEVRTAAAAAAGSRKAAANPTNFFIMPHLYAKNPVVRQDFIRTPSSLIWLQPKQRAGSRHHFMYNESLELTAPQRTVTHRRKDITP